MLDSFCLQVLLCNRRYDIWTCGKWLKKMKIGEEIHLAKDIRWGRGRLVYSGEVEVKRVSGKVKNSKSLTHATIPVKALPQDVHPQS